MRLILKETCCCGLPTSTRSGTTCAGRPLAVSIFGMIATTRLLRLHVMDTQLPAEHDRLLDSAAEGAAWLRPTELTVSNGAAAPARAPARTAVACDACMKPSHSAPQQAAECCGDVPASTHTTAGSTRVHTYVVASRSCAASTAALGLGIQDPTAGTCPALVDCALAPLQPAACRMLRRNVGDTGCAAGAIGHRAS